MAGQVIYKIVTDGLILYLDAANTRSYVSGTAWLDLSGNNFDGSLINGPVFSSNNGGYIRCDGTNDYIEVIDNSKLDFGSNNFSVEYWFRKLQTTTSYDNSWGVNKWNTGGSDPGTNEWTLAIGNGSSGVGNQYALSVEVGSTRYSTGTSSEQLSLNVWYQIVGIRNGGSLQTYINGELKQNVSPIGFSSSSVINNVGRNLRISNSAQNANYTRVDNAIIRVYNKALSSDEVLRNYNSQKLRFGL